VAKQLPILPLVVPLPVQNASPFHSASVVSSPK